MTAARWRPRLSETLAHIAGVSDQFVDDWWIIGSAAAAISGADIAMVNDVDLLLSEADARRLARLWEGKGRDSATPDALFRSAVLSRYDMFPLPVEAFGGFEMNVRGRWRSIAPLTRLACGAVFTPSIAEQITLLETMGREKDGARIAALKRRL